MSTTPSARQSPAGLKVNVPVIWAAPLGSTSVAVRTYSPATEQVEQSALAALARVGQINKQAMAHTPRGDVIVCLARQRTACPGGHICSFLSARFGRLTDSNAQNMTFRRDYP
jgi:hypothetical protein